MIQKLIGSISMDLDNQWSYMKTHNDPGWEKFPSYLDIVIPSVLEILDRANLKITFFLVGQDAALNKNKDSLRLITKHGHEVGNHSFHHEVWLNRYSKEKLREEILTAGNCISEVTGQKPVGFRGPGFSWSPDLLEVLSENKYLFDASTFPTFLGPIARMYYFWTSNLTAVEKRKRKSLFGKFRDGLRSGKPFLWQLRTGARLLEIPVTTMPVLKIPMHLSYLLYLSRFSQALMYLYLKIAIALCKRTGSDLSFLLHPLDLISGNMIPELSFFPGMDLTEEHKSFIFRRVITILSRHFGLVKMSEHASAILEKGDAKAVVV